MFEAALLDLESHGVGAVCFASASAGPETELCRVRGPGEAGILLVLSMGSAMAERALDLYGSVPEPVDTFSRELAGRFMASALPGRARLLYPGVSDKALDLRAWLRSAGAQLPSRLGVGIRPDGGPWAAVRAAMDCTLLSEERASLARRYPTLLGGRSPCLSCDDPPCVRACPAGAVGEIGHFELGACLEERLRPASGCASSCDARLACPEGASFRYSSRALRYHYGVSLQMIKRWRQGE